VQKRKAIKLKKPRRLPLHFHGQENVQPLIDFLNKDGPVTTLLEKLIDAAERRHEASVPTTEKDFQHMAEVMGMPRIPRKVLRIGPAIDRPRKNYETVYQRASEDIKAILDKVSFTPIFLATVKGRWVVTWAGAGVQGSEADALFRFLQLAADGLLKKVARCADPACRKWFFRALPQAKFHAKKCRVRVYETDEERKEARRSWAKEHYRRFESRKGFSRRGRRV
jgi:hypothetical protein